MIDTRLSADVVVVVAAEEAVALEVRLLVHIAKLSELLQQKLRLQLIACQARVELQRVEQSRRKRRMWH